MKYFKLASMPKQYKVLSFGRSEMIEGFGGDMDIIKKIRRQPSKNCSLKDIWVDLDLKMRDMPDAVNPAMPDISLWKSLYPLLSEKAYAALKDEMAPFGEFLPIKADGQRYYIFNCLVFGKEDEAGTELEYSEGIPIGIKSLAFDEEDVKDKLLFKSEISFCGNIFCGEKLKELCNKNLLGGLYFENNLLKIFE